MCIAIAAHGLSWNDIWQRKGTPLHPPNSLADLIAIDGFEHANQFQSVLTEYASLVQVRATDVVCDVGGGSGAFLHVLPRFALAVSVDLSDNLLKVSQQYIQTHRPDMQVVHMHAAIEDMWPLPARFCDVTIVQSVFQYLPDLVQAQKAVTELERVTKPGGHIYVFDLRDGDKQAYTNQRSKAGMTHSETHLFVPRSFWTANWRLHDPSVTAQKVYYNAPFSYHATRRLEL